MPQVVPDHCLHQAPLEKTSAAAHDWEPAWPPATTISHSDTTVHLQSSMIGRKELPAYSSAEHALILVNIRSLSSVCSYLVQLVMLQDKLPRVQVGGVQPRREEHADLSAPAEARHLPPANWFTHWLHSYPPATLHCTGKLISICLVQCITILCSSICIPSQALFSIRTAVQTPP